MPTSNRIKDGGTIGIVVIGRNESARLSECLDSLSRFRGRIVYSDSASTDGSPDIARQFGALVIELDGSTPLTPARGRNEGLAALLKRHPECTFVQFVDGDSWIEPGWIERGVEFLKTNERIGVVCGHVAEAQPERSIYNWLCGEEWKGPIGPVDSCGGNAMFRIASLLEAGGFRADLVAGEEAELLARMRARGWAIWRLDTPMVIHDADIRRFADWWKRAQRGGHSYAHVWMLTKAGPEPLYAAQIKSSLIWVILLPLAIILASVGSQAPALLLLLPAAWLMQIIRIAARRGLSSPKSWNYAGLIMLAKIAESTGMMHYFSKKLSGRPAA